MSGFFQSVTYRDTYRYRYKHIDKPGHSLSIKRDLTKCYFLNQISKTQLTIPVDSKIFQFGHSIWLFQDLFSQNLILFQLSLQSFRMNFGETNFRCFLIDPTISFYEGYRDKCCSSNLKKMEMGTVSVPPHSLCNSGNVLNLGCSVW